MERTDILLLLLATQKTPIVGTTRLQKLVFLIEQESNINIKDEDFDFSPNYFGPASDKLYDDLNFLENLGFIERSGQNKFEYLDINKIENYDADKFLSGTDISEDSKEISDINNKEDDLKIYKITQKGRDFIENKKLGQSVEANSLQNIVKKYAKYPLIKLLQYVYSSYPEYAINSIIKDQI